MPFLDILLPTGHRDKIEVTANSLLISVLDEICIKRNFNIDYCYLIHNKVKIDLSAKFCLTKLINNSKLELIISPVSLVDNVPLEITLQLPNAIRVTNCFCPHDSLWDILVKCVATKPEYESIIFSTDVDLTPVMFHFHYQIIGEYCLRNSTLSSLGFRSGKALLRFELKQITENEIQDATELLNAKLKRFSDAAAKANQIATTTEPPESVATESVKINTNVPHIEYSSIPKDSNRIQDVSLNDFSPFSMFPSNHQSLLEEFAGNNRKNAQNKKSPTLGELIGFNLEHEAEDWQQPQSIIDFKFPEETVGKNLMEIDEKPNENTSITHDTRESVFFYRKQSEYSVSEDDVPDSFFEVTEQDLREIINSYGQSASSNVPLMTKSLKEQLREAQFSKYQRCIIQFHFQDAYILQSVFQPKETIGDLYGYVKYYLQNVNGDFNLYTSPPKEILKDKDLTLIKSGLVPMSKIYVSVKAKEFCQGNVDVDMLSIGDENRAQELVSKWMKTENPGTADSHQQQYVPTVACGQSETAAKRPNMAKGTKVPKWFHK